MEGPPLVGRERELAAVARVVDRVRGGRLGLLLVTGEAGIGKTTLVRRALRDAGARSIWASGDEAEADVDHGIIEQLVRAARIGDHDRAAIVEAVGGDPLRTGALIVQLTDRIDLDPARPAALVVDDAQWADAASLRALVFAARRLRSDPVLLCLVARSGGVLDAVERLVDEVGTRVEVAPLDRSAVRALATEVTGEPIALAVADRLQDHTGGNPLHLVALLREVAPGSLASLQDLPSPTSYAALVAAQRAELGPEARRLVEALAVVGEPTPIGLLGDLAEVRTAAAAADEAIGSGLAVAAEPRGGGGLPTLALSHPLVRAAVLADLPLAERGALHRAAGRRLDGLDGLRHRLLGADGVDGDLWREATTAARAEATRGAHGSAAALFGLAVGVAPDPGTRAATTQARLDQLLHAGRLDAAALLVPEVEASPRSAARSHVLGRAAYVLGPRRAATAHLLDAWSEVTGGGTGPSAGARCTDADLAGRVAAMLATVGVDRARGEEAAAWARVALELAPEQAGLASAAHMLASGHALASTFDEGCAELDALCAPFERLGSAAVGPVAADVRSARGLLRLWTHALDGAAEDFAASLHAVGERGAFVARETARFYLAEVRYRQGRWDDAVALAELSASLVDDSDQDWIAALPHATAARPLAARGEPADHHVERAVAAASSVGAGVAAVLARVAAIEVAVSRRDHERAVALGRELAQLGGAQVDERIAPWRATFVDALLALDHVEEAAAVAAELAGAPSTPLVRTDAARAAAGVAMATDDLAGLERAEAEGLAEDPEVVGPFPRARLELVLGRAWRRRGERRRAVNHLEPALGRFRALGANPWAEQVEQELAASGLRPSRRAAAPGAALTPQEQAVARLVAQGRTNREVAAELVVSAKTVEHHLSRIYAKVGVRSRTELAGRLRVDR